MDLYQMMRDLSTMLHEDPRTSATHRSQVGQQSQRISNQRSAVEYVPHATLRFDDEPFFERHPEYVSRWSNSNIRTATVYFPERLFHSMSLTDLKDYLTTKALEALEACETPNTEVLDQVYTYRRGYNTRKTQFPTAEQIKTHHSLA